MELLEVVIGLCFSSTEQIFKVSVIGLERALEQYMSGADFDKPFDLKVVPISTLPITVTEIKKPSLSVETALEKKEEKISRQDIYAGE